MTPVKCMTIFYFILKESQNKLRHGERFQINPLSIVITG